jgi:hypothetical protein
VSGDFAESAAHRRTMPYLRPHRHPAFGPTATVALARAGALAIALAVAIAPPPTVTAAAVTIGVPRPAMKDSFRT